MSSKRPPNSLTKRQIMFVHNYVESNGNGTQSAIRAGYSEKSAAVTANKLLKRDDVLNYIVALKGTGIDSGRPKEVVMRPRDLEPSDIPVKESMEPPLAKDIISEKAKGPPKVTHEMIMQGLLREAIGVEITWEKNEETGVMEQKRVPLYRTNGSVRVSAWKALGKATGLFREGSDQAPLVSINIGTPSDEDRMIMQQLRQAARRQMQERLGLLPEEAGSDNGNSNGRNGDQPHDGY